LLVNPTNPGADIRSKRLQAAASARGLRLHILHVSSERDFETTFRSSLDVGASALLISPDPLFTSQSQRLGALTVRHALPAIYQFRTFAVAGGLMSYGGSVAESHHQAGIYTGRILKGERPAELPVHQATRVEMILNLKTAKALGLEIPPTLLARADE